MRNARGFQIFKLPPWFKISGEHIKFSRKNNEVRFKRWHLPVLPWVVNISRILSNKYMKKRVRNLQNVKRAPILAKNKYLYRPRFLYFNSPFCGLKENKNNLSVKFWEKNEKKKV